MKSVAVRIVISVFFCLVGETSLQAAVLRMALSGESAPGGNGTFTKFGVPVISESGKVAFYAVLSGTTSTQGIFAAFGPQIQTVVRQNDEASEEGRFASFFLGVDAPSATPDLNENLRVPSLNAKDQIGFSARLSEVVETENAAFYLYSQGNLVEMVRSRLEISPDRIFALSLYNFHEALNDVGELLYMAQTVGGDLITGPIPGHVGYFMADGTTQFQLVGGLITGSNFSSASIFPALNNRGEFAFCADPPGGGVRGNASDEMIVLYTGGSAHTLWARGQAAPNGDGSLAFLFNHFVLDNQGQVIFKAELMETAAAANDVQALYRATTNSLVELLRKGQRALGAREGIFDDFYYPVVNERNQTVVVASISGTETSDDHGLYLLNGTNATVLLRARDPSPDGDGEFVLVASTNHYVEPSLNNRGQVAIRAFFGPYDGPYTDDGIIFVDEEGTAHVVARKGELVDGSRIVSLRMLGETQDGNPINDRGGRQALNDNGQLVYRATLDDGRQALFAWNLGESLNPNVVNPIPDLVVDQNSPDTLIQLRNVFLDPETPAEDLRFRVQFVSYPDLVDATINSVNDTLTLRYNPSLVGSATITIRATDSDGLYTEDTFMVMVGAAGTTPIVVNPIANWSTYENAPDTVIDLWAVFEDGNNEDEALIFSVVSNTNPGLIAPVIDSMTGQLILSYRPDQFGNALLTVRATDPEGNYAEDTFIVSVRDVPSNAGNVDPSFVADFDTVVGAIALQPDGKILIGGGFSEVNGIPRENLARLHPDGTLDQSFQPEVNKAVGCIVVQPDGSLLLGGGFTFLQGEFRSGLAKLLPDLSLDTNWGPELRLLTDVSTICVQPDEKILVAGSFEASLGERHFSNLLRLNPDGTIDLGFNSRSPEDAPSINDEVICLELQPEGKILIGGIFTRVGGTMRNRLARLNSDGTLDTTFVPADIIGSLTQVASIATQSDGKIIVGGIFTMVGGQARRNLAQLNADGSLDPSFSLDANSDVNTMAVQADGRILIGGLFFRLGPHTRYGIGQLNADGTFNSSFEGELFRSSFGLALREDGRILNASTEIERLFNEPASSSLTVPSRNRVQWLRGGAAPEVEAVEISHSSNGGATWNPLGNAGRIPGGWEFTGAFPENGRIRALGRVRSGEHRGCSGLVRAVTSFSLPPDEPIRLTGIKLVGSGTIRVSVNLTNVAITVVATTNLSIPMQDWTTIGPATQTVPGEFEFTDPESSHLTSRYYRIRSP